MILTQLWLNYISNVRETIWFLDLKCDFCKGSHNLNAMIAWLHKASEKTWLTSTKSNGIFNDQSITIRPLINSHESIIIFRHFPNDPMVTAIVRAPDRGPPRLTNAEDALTSSGEIRPWNEKTIGTLHDFILWSSSGFGGYFLTYFHIGIWWDVNDDK